MSIRSDVSFVFSCPHCSEGIQATAELCGLEGRCPHCRARLAIPYRAGRGLTLSEAQALSVKDAWSTVRGGLISVRVGIVLLMAAVLLGLLGVMAGSDDPENRRFRVFLMLLTMFVMLFAAVGVVLLAVGHGMCCFAPASSGARRPALGAALSYLFAVLLSLAAFVFAVIVRPSGNRGDWIVLVIGLLPLACAFASHVLFVLFLKALGRCFSQQSLVRGSTAYLIAFPIFVVAQLALNTFVIAVKRGRGDFSFLMVAYTLMLVMGFILGFWFLSLVGQASHAASATRREKW
jgi:hypothetical protein